MTPPPLDEKVKKKKKTKNCQRLISKLNKPFSHPNIFSNRDENSFYVHIFFPPHSERIYAIRLRRPEQSGGGKHLLLTGGARCVKVSFTRVPSTFPLKERHRRCPTGTKLSTSSQNPSIEEGGGKGRSGGGFYLKVVRVGVSPLFPPFTGGTVRGKTRQVGRGKKERDGSNWIHRFLRN